MESIIEKNICVSVKHLAREYCKGSAIIHEQKEGLANKGEKSIGVDLEIYI